MDVVDQLWAYGAVADSLAVVGVNDTIFIDVGIADIAGTDGGEGLDGVVERGKLVSREDAVTIKVVALLEETEGLVAEELLVGQSGRNEVLIELGLFGLLLNLVLVEVDVTADVEGNLANLLAVVGCKLKAVAVNLTLVLVRSSQTEDTGVGSSVDTQMSLRFWK